MDFREALNNPSAVFAHPAKVLDASWLNQEQKIKVLRQWEYDARELEVAAEENMAGGPPSVLDDVLKALHALGSGVDIEHAPPTKQGGL